MTKLNQKISSLLLIMIMTVIFVSGCNKKEEINVLNNEENENVEQVDNGNEEIAEEQNEIDTSDWKVFNSKKDSGIKFDFTFKYPNTWFQKGSIDGGMTSHIPFYDSEEYLENCENKKDDSVVCRVNGKKFEIEISLVNKESEIEKNGEKFIVNDKEGFIIEKKEDDSNKYNPFISDNLIEFNLFDVDGFQFNASMVYNTEKDIILFKNILKSIVFN